MSTRRLAHNVRVTRFQRSGERANNGRSQAAWANWQYRPRLCKNFPVARAAGGKGVQQPKSALNLHFYIKWSTVSASRSQPVGQVDYGALDPTASSCGGTICAYHLLTAKPRRLRHPATTKMHRGLLYCIINLLELARPKRFELLTPRFVVWCSIQLSYGRLGPLKGESKP
jgi:hypothetical protein